MSYTSNSLQLLDVAKRQYGLSALDELQHSELSIPHAFPYIPEDAIHNSLQLMAANYSGTSGYLFPPFDASYWTPPPPIPKHTRPIQYNSPNAFSMPSLVSQLTGSTDAVPIHSRVSAVASAHADEHAQVFNIKTPQNFSLEVTNTSNIRSTIVIPWDEAQNMKWVDFTPNMRHEAPQETDILYPDNLMPPPAYDPLRCLLCPSKYNGPNARGMWRRHMTQKHRFRLSGSRNNTGRTSMGSYDENLAPRVQGPVIQDTHQAYPYAQLSQPTSHFVNFNGLQVTAGRVSTQTAAEPDAPSWGIAGSPSHHSPALSPTTIGYPPSVENPAAQRTSRVIAPLPRRTAKFAASCVPKLEAYAGQPPPSSNGLHTHSLVGSDSPDRAPDIASRTRTGFSIQSMPSEKTMISHPVDASNPTRWAVPRTDATGPVQTAQIPSHSPVLKRPRSDTMASIPLIVDGVDFDTCWEEWTAEEGARKKARRD